jgi:choline-sulfatase
MTLGTRTWIGLALLAGGAVGVRLLLTTAPLRPASVILITLDTTRADRLAPYGGPSGVMPILETWARHGVVFDDASTVAPLTLPAHTSLMTGQMPPVHGVRDNSGALLPTARTLAEGLHEAGYRTGAFVSAVVLDKTHGLDRGFDCYREVNQPDVPHRFRRPGNETVDEALAWLAENADSRFFVWIHLYDAHAPIRLAEPYRTEYAADPYAGALAFMDSQLGRVQAFLEARGLAGRTAIVLAADHGESLGEHGEQGHGIFVYQSVVHVPLIVDWPGLRTRRVTTSVQLTDVAPTVLALNRARGEDGGGRSLVPLLRGLPMPAWDVYAESMYPRRFGWSDLRSLRSENLKVIDAPRPELYDLAVDPTEQTNLIDQRPGPAAVLLDRLRRVPTSGTLAAATSETARQLGALGYATAPDRHPRPTVLPDPKDMISRYNRVEALRSERH